MPLPPPPHRSTSRKRPARTLDAAARRISAATTTTARETAACPSSRDASAAEPTAPYIMSPGAVTQVVKDAVAMGLKDGLRGIRADLNALRQTCAATAETVATLCTTVNTQGVGAERTAVALKNLSGAVQGGFSSVMDVVEPASAEVKNKGVVPASTAASLTAAAETGNLDAMRKVALLNESHLKDIRKVYQSTLKKDMLTTNESAKSFPTTAMTQRHRMNPVRTVMKFNDDEASDYLDSVLYYPVQKKNGAPVKRRVVSKLVVTLPHIFQGMKRLSVPVSLKRVGLSKKKITGDTCALRKKDNSYFRSPRGRGGIAAAITVIYRKEGLLERLVEAQGVGDLPYAVASTGFFSMVSMFVRSFVEQTIVAEAKNKKDDESNDDNDSVASGDDDAANDSDVDDIDGMESFMDNKRMLHNTRWQAELIRVDGVLPRSADVLHGFALVDGHSAYCAGSGPPQGEPEAQRVLAE